MLRVTVNVVSISLLHNFAKIHNCNAVTYVPDDREVVSNKQICEVLFLFESIKQTDDLCLN